MSPGVAVIGSVLLLAVAFAWIWLLARVLRGTAVLEFEPCQEPPWGVVAVALSFVLLITCQGAVAATAGSSADEVQTVERAWNSLVGIAIGTMTAMLLSILAVGLVFRATRRDLGISLKHVPRDLFIGVTAFLLLGPIAYFIQFIFVYIFEFESTHPLIELLKQDDTNQLLGMVTIVAVIVAPLAEEYFFRVLLQGWLERLSLYEHGMDEEWQSSRATNTDSDAEEEHPPSANADDNPYAPPTIQSPATTQDAGSWRRRAESLPGFLPAVFPIVASAAIFALMHWSHGPDPAALFVFALGLGYVYQRTHRLLPCVVTHFCLNATTIAMLWLGLDELQQ